MYCLGRGYEIRLLRFQSPGNIAKGIGTGSSPGVSGGHLLRVVKRACTVIMVSFTLSPTYASAECFILKSTTTSGVWHQLIPKMG